MMKHSREIIRWAESPDGTKIWIKNKNFKEWTLKYHAMWNPESTYIVDDEWAEIRKAFIDGKTIELKFDEEWGCSVITNVQKFDGDGIELYRIKPDEPVYEWQWIRCAEGVYHITNCFYSTVKEIQSKHNYDWTKFKSSKRERR